MLLVKILYRFNNDLFWFLFLLKWQTPKDVDKLRSIGVKTIFCLQQDSDLEYPKKINLPLCFRWERFRCMFCIYAILYMSLNYQVYDLSSLLSDNAVSIRERDILFKSLTCSPDILGLTSLPFANMPTHLMTFNTCVLK